MQSYYETTAEQMRYRNAIGISAMPITVETEEFSFQGKPQADPEAIQQALELANGDRNNQSVYSSFSGSDMLVEVDGTVIGEVQAFSYHRLTKKQAMLLTSSRACYDSAEALEYPVTIVMTYTLFGGSDFEELQESKTYSIVLKLVNEYGDKREYHFSDVQLVSESMSMSIDEISLDYSQILRAKSMDKL